MSLDYSKVTVEQIKSMVLNDYGIDPGGLTKQGVKGKAEWVKVHMNNGVIEKQTETVYDMELDDVEVSLDNFKNDLDNIIEENEGIETESTPGYNDPGWNDYVMSMFAPEELVDGKYPNVNALRRVAGLLLGDIVFSGPVRVEQTMDPGHSGKATVTYQVTIDWKLDDVYVGNLDVPNSYGQRNFVSVASSWMGNTDDMFAVFPESIAETRAEGRSLRRALRINVVCADELTKKDTAAIVQQQKETVTTTGEWKESDLITDQQIHTLRIVCDRLNIDITKFINSGSKKYSNINEINKAGAAGMFKQLNRYQSSGKESVEIPLNLMKD